MKNCGSAMVSGAVTRKFVPGLWMPSVVDREPTKRMTRRGADRPIAASEIEADTARGQPVDVRVMDHKIAMAARDSLQVGDQNEKHVGILGASDSAAPKQNSRQR